MPDPSFLLVLARTILAGEPEVEQVRERLSLTVGRRWRWLRPLAQRYVESISGLTRPRQRDVVRFLRCDEGFGRAWRKYSSEIAVQPRLSGEQAMQPVPAAQNWD